MKNWHCYFISRCSRFFLFFLLFLSISCSTTYRSMISHSNSSIRLSSNAGDQIGLLLGFPLVIMLSPVTMIMAAEQNDEHAAWLPLAPAIFLRRGCGILFGMPAWLMSAGWSEKSFQKQDDLVKFYCFPNTIHLGHFPANQVQEGIVTLSNPSANPASVGTVRTTCGCLITKLSTREIPAHGQISLTVQIPPEGVSGAFIHLVFIEIGGETGIVEIDGEAIPLATVTPQQVLNAGTLTAGRPYRQEFLITTAEPVRFEEPVTEEAEAVLEKQSGTRSRLTVTWTPGRESTLFRHTILLPVVSPPGWKPVKIVIHGRVLSQSGVKP